MRLRLPCSQSPAGFCGAGDAAYDAFVHRHGRRHDNAEEYEGRRQVFHKNRAKIEAWNADGSAHECANRAAHILWNQGFGRAARVAGHTYS